MHRACRRAGAALAAAGLLLAGAPTELLAAQTGRAKGTPGVGCEACIVVDDQGGVLWARRADRVLPMASTTKMVTALVTVRNADLEAEVTVSAQAARVQGGGLALEAGDRYTVRELLLALLLSSSNDSAVALAQHVSGSEVAFVTEMNALADELGADSTQFVNAHGLDAAGHHSTARDLVTIAEAVLRDPQLAAMVATVRAIVTEPRRGSDELLNRNPLLQSYDGAIGVKTGYTAGAGNVLVAAAVRAQRRVIAVAMRSQDAVADVARLLDYGFARLRRGVLLKARAPVAAVVFDSGAVPLVASETVRGITLPARVSYRFESYPAAAPPVKPGDALGVVEVSGPGGTLATVEAVAAAPLERRSRSWAAILFELPLRLAAAVVPGGP